MTDIWFVFDNTGTFLFRTDNLLRTTNIPETYNAKYIIKNPPGYDPFADQKIFYNTETNSVEFSELTVTTALANFEEENIIAVDDLLIQIEANKEIINTLTTRIEDLESQVKIISETLSAVFPDELI